MEIGAPILAAAWRKKKNGRSENEMDKKSEV